MPIIIPLPVEFLTGEQLRELSRVRVRLNTKLLARVKRRINRPTKSPLPSFKGLGKSGSINLGHQPVQ